MSGELPAENSPTKPTVAIVRRLLRDEPQLWLQHDLRNRWFCPPCGEVINSIVLPPGTARGLLPDLPLQLVEHLQTCSAVQAGIAPQKRFRKARRKSAAFIRPCTMPVCASAIR